MSREKTLAVAMEGNQLLQKYIATRAKKERELEIGTLTEVHTGFVTGIDDRYVQITTSDELAAVLIGLANVTYVKETGYSVDALTDRDKVKKIREYTTVFRKLSERELEAS